MSRLFAPIICLLLFMSCSPSHRDLKILRVGLTAEVTTLDPAKSNDTVSATVISQTVETLYEYEYLRRPYSLKPLLANSMPLISADGKHYTIPIKKGILYQPDISFGGEKRELQAQDFINQFKRIAFIPTASSGWWLLEGKIVGLDRFRELAGSDLKKFFSIPVEGLSAPDPYTLEIKLVEPSPQLIYVLAMLYTSPVPAQSIRYYRNDFTTHLIGTGPFVLSSSENSDKMVMKKNEHFRREYYPDRGDREANLNNMLIDAGKELPLIDGIEFSIVKESAERWELFMNQKLHFLTLPVDYFSQVVQATGEIQPDFKKRGMTLQSSSTLTSWWLAFNMRDPLVGQNKNLRLAIAHAIDTENYIKSFTNNLAQKANSIYAPGIAGHDPAEKLNYNFNLGKAKEYLKLAGYPGGKGLRSLRYDIRGQSAQNLNQASLLKTALSKIGIKLTIVENSFAQFLQKAREGKLQFWLGGWTYDYPDAENLLQLLITRNMSPGPNTTNYSNPQFDQYFDQIKIMPPGNAKSAILKKMEDVVEEDMPWIMLFYSRNFILTQSGLKNYRDSDLIFNHFKYLRLE